MEETSQGLRAGRLSGRAVGKAGCKLENVVERVDRLDVLVEVIIFDVFDEDGIQ